MKKKKGKLVSSSLHNTERRSVNKGKSPEEGGPAVPSNRAVGWSHIRGKEIP